MQLARTLWINKVDTSYGTGSAVTSARTSACALRNGNKSAGTQKSASLRGKELDVRPCGISSAGERSRTSRVAVAMSNPPAPPPNLGGQSWFEFNTPEAPEMTNQDSLQVMSALQGLGCGDLLKRPEQAHFPGSMNFSYLIHSEGGASFFVKINCNAGAHEMFEGEKLSLEYLSSASQVRVPQPLAVGSLSSGGAYLIMEGLKFRPFAMIAPERMSDLGASLARGHLSLPTHAGRLSQAFGFPVPTNLGSLQISNNCAGQSQSWGDFFVEHRLMQRLNAAVEKIGTDIDDGWLAKVAEHLETRAAALLEGHHPQAAMLHGDLWLGNTGVEGGEGQVVMFDPAGFVGDPEFDLAFRGWDAGRGFPGFSDEFYTAYHEVIPKAPGFEERHALYRLFHLLNHLCMYGLEYYPFIKRDIEKVLL